MTTVPSESGLPPTAAGLVRHAAAEAAAGRNERALELVTAVLAGGGLRPVTMAEAGLLLADLGRLPEAEGEIERALRLAPDDAEVRFGYAQFLFRRGAYARAAEALRSSLELVPDRAIAHYLLGEALNRLDRPDAALAALRRALELAPDDVRTLQSLGRLYDRLDLPDEAAEMFRRAREVVR